MTIYDSKCCFVCFGGKGDKVLKDEMERIMNGKNDLDLSEEKSSRRPS